MTKEQWQKISLVASVIGAIAILGGLLAESEAEKKVRQS